MGSKKKAFAMGGVRPDAELWEAVANGDGTAFSLLFDRYWPIVYKTVFSYIKDGAQSEEITHDIFLNLWRGRHTFQILSFRAYLLAGARYHVYRFMKSAKASTVKYIDNWDQISVPKVANAGAEKIATDEWETDIAGLLADLPARCREIFLLSRKENLSNDEIADRLGISKRSVENQITRALKHLRVQLKTLTYFVWLIITIFLFL
ncbi:RNA polymerase sigma factor [Parapedobacter deserti]|uniref:RNA polymerase sigma factor n=1 Tax=Parapedobacter deserti TaxID=1912957 RepID=A0ABV7JJZ4_9SPHI